MTQETLVGSELKECCEELIAIIDSGDYWYKLNSSSLSAKEITKSRVEAVFDTVRKITRLATKYKSVLRESGPRT